MPTIKIFLSCNLFDVNALFTLTRVTICVFARDARCLIVCNFQILNSLRNLPFLLFARACSLTRAILIIKIVVLSRLGSKARREAARG